MNENEKTPGEVRSDDALFETLNRNRKKKRRKTLITVGVILLLAVLGIGIAVRTLRKRVEANFTSASVDVESAEAFRGTVSTTVSGSGTLADVGSEQVTVPYGVVLGEIIVKRGETVKEGDTLATVTMASVMQTLSDTKEELDELDEAINGAGSDSVSSYINTGVAGRVKRILAEKGTPVVDAMSEYGALCVLSLDGCMCCTLPDTLPAGTAVKVVCSDGKEYPGTVENTVGSGSTVTLTDDGPLYGDTVTVLSAEGKALGESTLEIHSPLSVTGYAGTVSAVYVKENQKVSAWSTAFTLTDTGYTANLDALLQSRSDAEERLGQLIAMLRTGCVAAPFDGIIYSLDYSANDTAASSSYGSYTVTPTETAVLTMAPMEEMSVTLSVDETDILSLKVGQEALVTVSSADVENLAGTVTEVDRVADGTSGVTAYTAVVTLPRTESMLSGMTASVDIRIQGVEDAILVPADAVHSTKDVSFVYTSYNEETHMYGGMKNVVVGVSDGNYIEIISGLEEGETVFYVEQEDNDPFAMMMGMGGGSGSRPGGYSSGSRPGGSMPGGGSVPSGGQRPGNGGRG